MPLPTTTVVIINDNEETLATLQDMLQHEHFHVIATRTRDARGAEVDFVAFLTPHDPHVIIWDVPVPYEKNWTRLTVVRSTGGGRSERANLSVSSRATMCV